MYPCSGDAEPELYGRGVPGVGRTGGWWEGYTGYYPAMSQGPIFSIFSLRSPTHGQMKAFPNVSMRFPEMGPDMASDMTQN